MLTRAWSKAGIDPETVTYIEAHGTATRLGDPIEVEAIDLAFRRFTDKRGFCALSSVKSNIGHTWSAAGLVGLVKAALALRHQVLFPNVHSAVLSPLINFSDSAVSVTRELTPWEFPDGLRRAGVSSFGIMGTNVHAVLEEAPIREEAPEACGPCWFPVSAKTTTALKANLAALRHSLDVHPELRIQDIQRTLVAGRSHFSQRDCVLAHDRAELAQALAEPGPARHCEDAVSVVLLAGCCPVPAELTAAMRENSMFDESYIQCERTAEAAESGGNPRIAEFAFQYATYKLLRSIGLQFKHIVGAGAGKYVLDAVAGRIELGEAIRRAVDEPEITDVDARVDRLLSKLVGERPVTFVELGPMSTITQALTERSCSGLEVVAVPAGPLGVPAFLRELYLAGANWRWASTGGDGRRIELPSYQFDRVWCWLDEGNRATRATADDDPEAHVVKPCEIGYLDAVIQVWRDVLGVETVDPEASFYELGGDSISSIHVLGELQDLFGVKLDAVTMVDDDTPSTLARHVEQVVTAANAVVTPAELQSVAAEHFPASLAQLHIWLAAQFERGSVAFNLVRCFRFDGPVDQDALRRALDALLARHDGLRASFRFADGELVQRIKPPGLVEFELLFSDADEVDLELITEFGCRPFDLEHGPLLRAQLVKFGGNRQVLTLSTHHIVADGWSLEVLVRDLGGLYSAFASGTAPQLASVDADYRGYHLRQAQRINDHGNAAAAYWLDRFDPFPAALDLPLPRGVSRRTFTGACRDYELPHYLCQRLVQFSKAQGVTLFTSTMSAFAASLSRHSEHGDLVLGTSIAGRDGGAVEHMVAMLVRTLPLRIAIDPILGFSDLCSQVRAVFGEALRHPDFPYENLVAELRRRGICHSSNLFDVLIEFERFGVLEKSAAASCGGFDATATPLDVSLPTSVHPLNIMLAEHDGTLTATIRFDTTRFDEKWVDTLWLDFQSLLEMMLDHPDSPLRELPLLSEGEQLRMRDLGYREFRFDETELIHRVVERHAAQEPHRLCLSQNADHRTFGELNSRANQLARYFSNALNVRPGDIVTLVMDRSILMVESILALWKCSAAYLPIDPQYPSSFIRRVLDSSSTHLAVIGQGDEAVGLRINRPAGCRLVELPADLAGEETANLDLPCSGSDLAYVIYTSGSTGTPKGAMVEHLGMLNHLHTKIADLELDKSSVVVQNASNSFDISVWQMFAALFVGGRTVIVDQRTQMNPLAFAERLETERVTVLEVVPSYLDVMLDSWESARPPVALADLRHLLVTGDTCLPRQVNRWLKGYPAVPVVNAYGPTEASDDVTHHMMSEFVDTEFVPIGKPVFNTRIYVLDEHMRVCPQGERGEIYASGICVGRGYLNSPHQTARSFLRDPFSPEWRMYRTGDFGRWTEDGLLEYLGRVDSQTKIRGFRVDLGEIERKVASSPGIKSAAVVSRMIDRNPQLCAYVVLAPGSSTERCRTHLANELPQHMIPTEFVAIERLPLTPAGKVDRKALELLQPIRSKATTSAEQPRTEIEQALIMIWQDVLGLTEVEATDRFFEIGGDSLRAIRILNRVREALNVDLTLETLFTHPSVAELAPMLATAQAAVSASIISLGGPGRYAVAPTQQLLLDIEHSSPQRAAFNRNDLFELDGEIDPDQLRHSFAQLVERHESLRTTYEGGMQVVHSIGDLDLPFQVHDLNGEPQTAVQVFLETRMEDAFDIAREPLIRADLIRTREDRWLLLTAMHQLVSDGVSADVMRRDWQAFYEHERPELLAVQYKDVAARLASQLTPGRQAEHREFWFRELAGASSVVPIVTDFPRPQASSLSGTRLRTPVPTSLAHRVADLAATNGVTEFVVSRCAVGLLLLSETGLTEVTMGTYTQGRVIPGLGDQIGFHINTVPLRFRLLSGDSVRTMLTRGQHEVLQVFCHEEYPYGWTMRDLGWRRGLDRAPMFDVMIAFDRVTPGEPGRTLFRPLELPRRSKEADLQFVFIRSAEGMELALTYNDEIFSRDRMTRLLTRLHTILDRLTLDHSIQEILRP